MEGRSDNKEPNPSPAAPERRYRPRKWQGQVDFWENVKEFILRRVKPGSEQLEKLY
ncbi:MAG: hypothetical protein JO102_04615 [Elusimicrobia bacterium]|nr:hypothetical protein [Elusimicrobiota bacterium]